MANKSILDVDVNTSSCEDDAFFINSNQSLKQIKKNNIRFDYDTHIENKPAINGVELRGGEGVKLSELGIASKDEVSKKADEMIHTARGERIAVGDSADAFFEGLKLYGKSEQNGSPTPDNPIPIKICGDGGKIGIEVSGKNLLQESKIKRSKDNVYLFNDNNGFLVKKNENYVLSFSNVANAIFLIEIGKNSSDAIKKVTNDKKLTFTATEDMNVYFNIYIPGASESITNIQFEYAKDPTNYEEMKSIQSMSVPTPNGLPGIKVDSGGNYTDSNGQQWVCDEMDFKRGKYVQRIKKLVLNGNEEWALQSINGYGIANFATAISKSRGSGNVFILSSHFREQKTVIAETKDGDGIFLTAVSLFLRFKKERISTVTDLKAWLKENPVTVIYDLAYPIETDIPEETMTAYRKLYTNYPSTVIQNDSGAGMEVEYSSYSQRANKKDVEYLEKMIQSAQSSIANLLSLMPLEIQAAMIENDTNNLLYTLNLESEETV